MKLTFEGAALAALISDAKKYWPNGANPLYGQKETAKPGFWLVGDDGVYIMHNGKLAEGETPNKAAIVFANECNPETMPFDEWWEMKRATFGGDDGAEFLDMKTVRPAAVPGGLLEIEFTRDEFIVSATFPKGGEP